MRELDKPSLIRLENISGSYTYHIYITNERELEQACEWLDHKEARWGFTQKKVTPDYRYFIPRRFNYVLTVSVNPEKSGVTYSEGLESISEISDDWGGYPSVGYIRANNLPLFCPIKFKRGEQLDENY